MTFRRHLALSLIPAAVLIVGTVTAEERHVEARLVADVDEIRAGEIFLLGVTLKPEPGWHVYWRNPGEAGLSTEVLYELPEGFEAGELLWPVPVEFEQPGKIVGYGYEAPVVLAAEITTPPAAGGPISVTLDASWLACKDVCVLESSRLTAELPLAGSEAEASGRAFDGWGSNLPTKSGSDAFELTVTGGPVPASGPGSLAVWLNWKQAPGPVEFFPDPGASLKVEGVRVQSRGLLTRVDLTVSHLKTADTPATHLRSLVVTVDENGKRSGRTTSIDLR